jgi:hypothetical protein
MVWVFNNTAKPFNTENKWIPILLSSGRALALVWMCTVKVFKAGLQTRTARSIAFPSTIYISAEKIVIFGSIM